MSHPELDQLTRQAEKLNLEEKRLLLERIFALIEAQEAMLKSAVNEEDVTWTKEELEELLTPEEPLTGEEMIAQGYFGGWEAMGIEDGAEWVNQLRARSKARRKKKLEW